MSPETRWYHLLAYFVGGAFVMNAVPHLVMGVTGRPFPSPFARPPGEGLSSPVVNTLWGCFNLAVGYLLTARVGNFGPRRTLHALALGLGALLMALGLASHFGSLPR